MILPGWNCAECLTFNGEQKEPLHECRACGRPRKTFGLPLETMMRHLRLLEENVTATQRRCTEQEEELRKLRPVEGVERLDLTREEARGVFIVIHHWKSLFEAGTLHPQDAAYKKAFEVNERLKILLGISSG